MLSKHKLGSTYVFRGSQENRNPDPKSSGFFPESSVFQVFFMSLKSLWDEGNLIVIEVKPISRLDNLLERLWDGE